MTGANNRSCGTWRDEEERERLLMEQLPQVRYIARRIHDRLPRHVPLEDLVHAGVVGLIDALHIARARSRRARRKRTRRRERPRAGLRAADEASHRAGASHEVAFTGAGPKTA